MLLRRGLFRMRLAPFPISLEIASFSFYFHASSKPPESANPNVLLLCIFTSFRKDLGAFASRNDDLNLFWVEGMTLILTNGFLDVRRC